MQGSVGQCRVLQCRVLQCRARAPENLKWAGNWPKVAAMCGLQNYKKKTYISSFKLTIPITKVFMHLFWAFRQIWLATSIFASSFRPVDTYIWSYFSWLANSGCQNHKLAGNTFPPFPSFWSPVQGIAAFCRIGYTGSRRDITRGKPLHRE